MSIRRAWYSFDSTPGGEQDYTHYDLINFFPACTCNNPYICAIYGLYDPCNYGNHPAPLTLDRKLSQYIIDAKAAQTCRPSGPQVKKYVYMRGTL